MQFNNDKWLASLKKAVQDTKMQPTAGLPCAIAAMRFVRDAMIEELGEQARENVETFFNGKDGFIQAIVQAKNLQGFACNASAAAKAAKLETASATLPDLQD